MGCLLQGSGRIFPEFMNIVTTHSGNMIIPISILLPNSSISISHLSKKVSRMFFINICRPTSYCVMRGESKVLAGSHSLSGRRLMLSSHPKVLSSSLQLVSLACVRR